ncbi:MAG: response regulator [Lachnospiraceae bacterium]|nr:response regulator [Lachnospiraceae bacterium]
MDNNKVIRTLSKAYFGVYFVNLENHAYEEVYAQDFIKEIIPSKGNSYEGLMDDVIPRVYEQFADDIKKLGDSENTKIQLTNADSFFVECKTKVIGWIRIVMMAADRNEKGEVTSILVAGQNIDEEMQDAIEAREEMRAAYVEANRANASKTEFLSKMSHDIRTPMNAIMGMTTIAAKHLDDKEKVRYCIETISEAGRHLLALINEVMDVTKIESGKIELVKDYFSVSGLVDNVLNMMQPLSDAKEQMLVLNMTDINHNLVTGDRTRVEEILTNLVSNAIKYTYDKGLISIDICEEEVSETYSDYIFKVKDSGIGMSKEFQKHIYEAFSREDDEYIAKSEGTGLGLTITKKYIEAMNGEISFKSEKGHGSEFCVRIRLELQKVDTDDMAAAEEDFKLDKLDFSGKRALLVDDNDLNAEIGKELLEMTGLTIERAVDGADAVNMFTTSPFGYYDIVFMDVIMPVMNGYDATIAIRASDRPDSSETPIIAMTANAFASDIREALEAGMNDHIAKPIDNEYLAKVLVKYLGEKQNV